jgi:hypothetical protein
LRLQPQPPKCWVYRYAPPPLVSKMLLSPAENKVGIEFILQKILFETIYCSTGTFSVYSLVVLKY